MLCSGYGSCIAGDRHEGEWQDGKEHGPGTAVAADGSSFYGSWQMGKRHGEGVSIFHSRLLTAVCPGSLHSTWLLLLCLRF